MDNLPPLQVTIDHRRWSCILDVRLALAPLGPMLALRLAEEVPVCLVPTLWDVLDNTAYFESDPQSLFADPLIPEGYPEGFFGRLALAQWDRARTDVGLSALGLYWAGDALHQSSLPKVVDPGVVHRFDAFGQALERRLQTARPELSSTLPSRLLDGSIGALALAAAMTRYRPLILSLAIPESDEPPLGRLLGLCGIPSRRIDREQSHETRRMLAPLLVRTGVLEAHLGRVAPGGHASGGARRPGAGPLHRMRGRAGGRGCPICPGAIGDRRWLAGRRRLLVCPAMSPSIAADLTPAPGVPVRGPALAPPIPWGLRQAGVPRLNLGQLAMVAVAGEIVPPGLCRSRDRARRNGPAPRLPGPGGIVLNQRIGDPCIGLAADRLEPGVAIRSLPNSLAAEPDDANRALNAYACIGNRALVLTGPARGQRGLVTGKHGNCDHVSVDFPFKVLQRLRIGDRLQIYAFGLGLRLTDHPELTLRHCSPRLLRRWGLASAPPRLLVPVTHRIPAGLLGPGDRPHRGAPREYALPLDDLALAQRLGLDRLRFGDLVAIHHPAERQGRFGPGGIVTVGVVVCGDSPVPGRGPGVIGLIAGDSRHLEPVPDPRANLAIMLGLRALPRARARRPWGVPGSRPARLHARVDALNPIFL